MNERLNEIPADNLYVETFRSESVRRQFLADVLIKGVLNREDAEAKLLKKYKREIARRLPQLSNEAQFKLAQEIVAADAPYFKETLDEEVLRQVVDRKPLSRLQPEAEEEEELLSSVGASGHETENAMIAVHPQSVHNKLVPEDPPATESADEGDWTVDVPRDDEYEAEWATLERADPSETILEDVERQMFQELSAFLALRYLRIMNTLCMSPAAGLPEEFNNVRMDARVQDRFLEFLRQMGQVASRDDAAPWF